uniref:Uncharacterized protein n=1 Tax=Oryza punctata TaxID=4537 RepID=A0A0E0LCD3_ORYPU
MSLLGSGVQGRRTQLRNSSIGTMFLDSMIAVGVISMYCLEVADHWLSDASCRGAKQPSSATMMITSARATSGREDRLQNFSYSYQRMTNAGVHFVLELHSISFILCGGYNILWAVVGFQTCKIKIYSHDPNAGSQSEVEKPFSHDGTLCIVVYNVCIRYLAPFNYSYWVSALPKPSLARITTALNKSLIILLSFASWICFSISYPISGFFSLVYRDHDGDDILQGNHITEESVSRLGGGS